jgi:ubiquinone/menaquinone biosynthesis C-methylase UbiE
MFQDADSYDRFMGRYSSLLAPEFVRFARVEPRQRVLDVGCGPGALTGELVRRGAAVSAADPSEPFVEAIRERFPGADVRVASAERLPFGDGEFDAALAQLVVHFMQDPVAGLREMARVTRPGGTVAACVWDIGGHRSPLSPFWAAVHRLGLAQAGEQDMAGVRGGQLAALFEAAGLAEVEASEVSAAVEHASFEEWWQPFTLGVGPAGAYYARLEPDQADALARDLEAHFDGRVQAVAWACRGYNPGRLAA